MNERQQETFGKLRQHMLETAVLSSTEALLGWDERTMLPPAAGEYRAEQMALLSGLIHERQTAPQVGEWLDELAELGSPASPAGDAGVCVREWKRQYAKRTRLSRRLVEELTRTAVQAQQQWVEARKQNDFQRFAPWLRKTVELKREQAEAVGYDACRYDALLDDYEPQARTEDVAAILGALREELRPMIAAVGGSPRRPRSEVLDRVYPVPAQEAFGKKAAALIGFDFRRGRLDVTSHPFCTRLGPNDCRITTRYNERAFSEAFFGTLHEAGHGIYEQGLRADQYGLPTGSYVSLGIHESQSRLWENLVGRGEGFWKYLYPAAQAAFPEALSDVRGDEFYFCINAVQPSLIRIEADEATYNMHIIIRFELELALIEDQLPVADLPEAWNQKYEQNLGIRPTSDADGVLQDIHWSAGLFGYFPTYSLGNLYAAMFMEAAESDLGGLQQQFAQGQFTPLREWLVQRIHQRGMADSPAELALDVAGKPLTHDPLMTHLRTKLAPLYGL